jgi:type III secretory pathway component EscR
MSSTAESDWGAGSYREGRGCGRRRFHTWELVAMILGFIVFWPIGLAILAWMIWAPRHRRDEANEWVKEQMASCREHRNEWHAMRDEWRARKRAFKEEMRARWHQRHGGGDWDPQDPAPTGNTAFDEWRAKELARIEEERKKLETAQREFATYRDDLRRAKDREEFDRFMEQRRNQRPEAPPQPPAPQPPAV